MATITNTNYFSPTQIAGCALWLDAADISSLFKDTAGTQLVTTNGDIVRRINDKSGNSRNATTSATTNIYKTSQSNGNSAIQVPSDSGFATPSFTVSSANTCSLFIVALQNSPLSGNVALFRNNTGANNTLRLQLESSLTRINVNSLGATTSSLMITRLGFPNIYSVGFDSSAITSFFNGTSTSGGQSGTSDGSLASSTTYAFATNTGMNGYFYEVILYNTNLTLIQRQAVEGYLAWKWGTQANLPTTHPYFYNPMIPNLILPAPLANPLITTNTTLITMNPTQIAGCSLWLDAADSSTMSFSGAIVTQWRDKSGNLNHATGPANGITLDSANNRLVFPPTGTPYLSNTTMAYPLSTRTIFIVAEETSTALYSGVLSFIPVPNTGLDHQTTNGMSIETTNGMRFYQNIAGYQSDLNSTTPTNPFPKAIYCDRLETRAGSGFVNGLNKTNVTATFTPGTSIGFVVGGRWTLGSSGYFKGYMYEILAFSSALSINQRQQIEGYLAWKWGLQASLPTTHPYFYNPLIPNLILPSQVYTLSPSFSPLRFSGLSLWLDAADTSRMTLVGSNISQYIDKSTNGIILSNATSANQPTLVLDSNNMPNMLFNGTSQFLVNSAVAASNLTLSNEVTIFFVHTPTNSTNSLICWANYSGGAFRINFHTPEGTTGFKFDYAQAGGGGRLETSIANYLTSGRRLDGGYKRGTTQVIRAYGLDLAQRTNVLTITGSTSLPLALGSFFNLGYYYAGRFCELVWYNRGLNDNEIQQIEGYLAWKWGLQSNLPATHPYAFSPPS